MDRQAASFGWAGQWHGMNFCYVNVGVLRTDFLAVIAMIWGSLSPVLYACILYLQRGETSSRRNITKRYTPLRDSTINVRSFVNVL